MVRLPTLDELHVLRGFDEPSCVTVYAPAIQSVSAGADNPGRIELKNLLRQAETELLDEGVTPRDIRKTLRPAWQLINSPGFRPFRHQSFVMFAHPTFFLFYHLPAALPHLVSIGQGFQLEPLLDAISDNQSYLVLALSHHQIRVFEGDRFTIRELRLKNLPSNMEESLGIDEYPKISETHAIALGGERGSEAYHGQYNENETDKQMLLSFFRKIDAALRKFLQRKDKPVILAGVGYLLPIYRRANTSPYLVAGGLAGNFEHEQPDAIRERAWRLLKNGGQV